jgi:hypothetical protein
LGTGLSSLYRARNLRPRAGKFAQTISD